MKFQLHQDLIELLPGVDPHTFTFTLGAQSGTVTALEVEPGTYSILLNGNSYEIRTGLLPEGATWVDLHGRRHLLDLIDPRNARPGGAAAQRSGQATLKSPMPGKVIRLLVSEGDSVEVAQGLVVIEAMKMQNEMKAPRAGVVRSIKTKEGATVSAGEALLVIE